jgi:hypothetical protein
MTKTRAQKDQTNLRNRYNRQIKRLSFHLDSFISLSEQLLANAATKTKGEIQEKLDDAKTLRGKLPNSDISEEEMKQCFKSLCKVFDIDYTE